MKLTAWSPSKFVIFELVVRSIELTSLKGNALPLKERKLKNEGCKKKKAIDAGRRLLSLLGTSRREKLADPVSGGEGGGWYDGDGHRTPLPNDLCTEFFYLYRVLFYFSPSFFSGSARPIDRYVLLRVIQRRRETNGVKFDARYVFGFFSFLFLFPFFFFFFLFFSLRGSSNAFVQLKKDITNCA